MGTKTISLDDEAYTRLKKEKMKNESFSDVVKRITKPSTAKPLLEFFGIWDFTKDEFKQMEKIIKSTRKQIDDLLG